MPGLEARLRSLQQKLAESPADGEAIRQVCQGLVDLCGAFAAKLAEIEESQEELHHYLETIDADLSRIEGQIFATESCEDEEDLPSLESAASCRAPAQSGRRR